MSEKGKLARELFLEGYNCAQSVVGAYAKELGLTKEQALLLSSPLGGGIGRMREVCGAVNGMMIVAGGLYGYSDPKNAEEKKRTYQMAQDLAKKFKEENGSIVCKELLGLTHSEQDPTPSPRTKEYYKKRPCADLVEEAADLLSELASNLSSRAPA